MRSLSVDDIVAAVAAMSLSELRVLEASVRTALLFHQHRNPTVDADIVESEAFGIEEGPSLNDWALEILEKPRIYELNLADQGLLASLVLSDVYQQETFSSRDIHNVIKESGRPPIANITSAISGLKERAYLTGADNKRLSLSHEGKKKARATIGMARREKSA